tara:strand:- start:267 stop:1082 length:816 start_codon:yes stop_codon:yes gene_type:complete
MKKLFFFLLKRHLEKNIKFKNIARSKECLIFGNGASLKNYNLKKFSEYDVIVTSMMYLHNEFKYLKVVADCEIAPFILYKYWRNPYSKKIEKNMKLEMLNKTNRFDHNHNYFLSLTNFFSKVKRKNFNYLYNFKNKNFLPEIDISNNFSYLSGSLFSMIGIAKYMGYKKIILIGTDYLLDTPIIGHFYEKNSYTINKSVFKEEETNFFENIKNEIDIKIIVPENYSSKYFQSITYKKFTNENEVKKNNSEIVSHENLVLLDSLNMKYKIFK